MEDHGKKIKNTKKNFMKLGGKTGPGLKKKTGHQLPVMGALWHSFTRWSTFK